MSGLVLEKEKNNPMGGIVLISKGSGWKRPTGVFLPDPGIVGDHRALTVLLWFHGYFVKDIPSLFYQEDTKILQAVLNSKRRLVVVAPHLGWFRTKEQSDYNASALGGGKACEQYLDQVLGALAKWYQASLIDLDLKSKPLPKFQIGDLYIAGHSGGGGGIRSSVASLGAYKEQLRECWGFDCLYGSGQTWHAWARTQARLPLYFYFGRGTKPSDHADVLGFWKLTYGTPKSPLSPAARMRNLYLAPALPGAELDRVAFQSSEDIKAKAQAGNRYEEIRKKVDPLLDDPAKYWPAIIKLGLKGHYQAVSELLGSRITQSIP